MKDQRFTWVTFCNSKWYNSNVYMPVIKLWYCILTTRTSIYFTTPRLQNKIRDRPASSWVHWSSLHWEAATCLTRLWKGVDMLYQQQLWTTWICALQSAKVFQNHFNPFLWAGQLPNLEGKTQSNQQWFPPLLTPFVIANECPKKEFISSQVSFPRHTFCSFSLVTDRFAQCPKKGKWGKWKI